MKLLAVIAAAALLAANFACGFSHDYVVEGNRLFSSQKYDDAMTTSRVLG